jgi:hypothetical protein
MSCIVYLELYNVLTDIIVAILRVNMFWLVYLGHRMQGREWTGRLM